jgi:hypothetical protein
MKENKNMKNQNIVIIAMAAALAFALAPLTQASISPQGGPTVEPAATGAVPAATATSTSPADALLPVISIHSAGNVLRGKTGSFVLKTSSPFAFGGMYVNFKVSGTAVAGVDYASLISPARIGVTGYAVLSLKTLADPRGSSNNKAYSVVVTLEPGPGYAVGKPNSATIFITNSCELEACW